MTDRQREILGFIDSSRRLRGYAPTYRELMARFGWRSTNSVREHLDALERRGMIARDKHLARAIVVTIKGEAALRRAAS